MASTALTVTELTQQIKGLLESHFEMVVVQGEISNLARPSSGHVYFNLKDEKSQIAGVMFRTAAQRLRFDLENGLEVLLYGRLGVYEPRGQYQLIVDRLEPCGSGALQLAFEQLKARLEKEGLFAPEHKKALPFIPRGIGIVTSPTGAAIRDILTVLQRRFPTIPVLINPVAVQGDTAAGEIARAIRQFQALPEVDVLIVGRGGGSIEDLWPFNEEIVARAIYDSRLPIISAVGHETDFTIADYVADLRAPTPSAAAELAVPLRSVLLEQVGDQQRRLEAALRRDLQTRRERLLSLHNRLRSPQRLLQRTMQQVDEQTERLRLSLRHRLLMDHHRLERLRQNLTFRSPATAIGDWRRVLLEWQHRLRFALTKGLEKKQTVLAGHMKVLNSLNPLAILDRGYAAASDRQGTLLASITQVQPDDEFRVHLRDGIVEGRVVRTKMTPRPVDGSAAEE